MTRLFDTHVVVDWSARSRPSPARPSRDAIWWAALRDGVAEAPVYVQTRAAALEGLEALIRTERAAGQRVLIGFDFPFGYPEGVARRICGSERGLDLIGWFADAVRDDRDNASNRFEVAARINGLYDGTGPFWGRPASWDHPAIPERKSDRHGTDHPPETRRADRMAGAKTVWQLAYAGSVGSQVIVGLPALHRLRAAFPGEVAIWPFDTGLSAGEAPVVLAEVYPSLLQPFAHAARRDDEVLDSSQVRVSAAALAGLDRDGALGPLFAGADSLTGGDREVVAREEAWILGLGHETALRQAAHRSTFIWPDKLPPEGRSPAVPEADHAPIR